MSTVLTYSRDDLAAMIARLHDETQRAEVIIVGETLRDARATLEGVARTLGDERGVYRVAKTIATSNDTLIRVTSLGSQGLRGRTAHLVAIPHGVVGAGTIINAVLVTRPLGGHVVAYTP